MDCVKETKAGNILGDLKCETKTGIYDAPDGKCATACTSIKFNKWPVLTVVKGKCN